MRLELWSLTANYRYADLDVSNTKAKVSQPTEAKLQRDRPISTFYHHTLITFTCKSNVKMCELNYKTTSDSDSNQETKHTDIIKTSKSHLAA